MQERFTECKKTASVMVWGAIAERGVSPFLFVPQGPKLTNKRYM